MFLEDFFDIHAERSPNPAYHYDEAVWCPNCGALYPGYLTPDWDRKNGTLSHICPDGIPRPTRGPIGTQL